MTQWIKIRRSVVPVWHILKKYCLSDVIANYTLYHTTLERAKCHCSGDKRFIARRISLCLGRLVVYCYWFMQLSPDELALQNTQPERRLADITRLIRISNFRRWSHWLNFHFEELRRHCPHLLDCFHTFVLINSEVIANIKHYLLLDALNRKNESLLTDSWLILKLQS